MAKWVYLFKEGNAGMRNLLGGKGANLAEMTGLGLPVPQGFTVTTEACTQYYEDGRQINDEIMGQIMEAMAKLEEMTGKKFGDKENPLLVSVRSGARASMPGMMDTILNLGLNEEVVETLAEASGNPRWAWDCYRRFIQMYSDVVMEVGKKYFEELIDKMKAEKGVKQDVELTAEDLKELAGQFKAEYKAKIGSDFPSDAKEQLVGAVKAVFRSWDNPRANVYRRDNDIPYSWGTAVNVQMMAFGNMGDDCGTGVAFTRDPATGEKGLFGEFLTNAQGEDVVAGVRTPMHISEMEEKFPEAFKQFKEVCDILEKHYRDMQDMELSLIHIYNAVESAIQTEEKKLEIRMRAEKGLLFLNIRNSCPEKQTERKGGSRISVFPTTKADRENHGIGLKNVQAIVEKYHGDMELACENGWFEADLMLYLKEL